MTHLPKNTQRGFSLTELLPLQNSQAGQRYQPAVESPPPFDSLSLARVRAGARRGAAESS